MHCWKREEMYLNKCNVNCIFELYIIKTSSSVVKIMSPEANQFNLFSIDK